jgi:hypothetical protein
MGKCIIAVNDILDAAKSGKKRLPAPAGECTSTRRRDRQPSSAFCSTKARFCLRRNTTLKAQPSTTDRSSARSTL